MSLPLSDELEERLTFQSGPWGFFPDLDFDLRQIEGRHAADYHDAVCDYLASAGWRVKREYAVSFNGHGGRIDIVAGKGRYRLALELDNRSPRGKSIIKLQTLPSHWLKGILLRNPKS